MGLKTGAARILWTDPEKDAAAKKTYTLYHTTVNKAIASINEAKKAAEASSTRKAKLVAEVCKLDPEKDFLDLEIEKKMMEQMKINGAHVQGF